MKYLELYKKEQEYILYNEHDPALGGIGGEHAIKVELPSVEGFFRKPWEEAIKEIDGYGLHPKNQKYDTYRDKGYYTMPPKLEALYHTIMAKRKSKDAESKKLYPEDYFDEVEGDPIKYKDEIDWIKLQIKRSLQGYWCFINGTPTYIDGWHYTYLNFWTIRNEKRVDLLPFFRDVDRRIFLFFKWAYTTTECFFKYKLEYKHGSTTRINYFNNKRNAELFTKREGLSASQYHIGEDGYFVDLGRRTCYGVVFPKRRRIGATSMGAHVCTRIAKDKRMGTFAIQALTEDTAKDDVYHDKIIVPFNSYPFFFKPSHTAHLSSALEFKPRQKVQFIDGMYPHNGWIRPRSSANKAFDGNKLFAYLNDESGKKEKSNVYHEFVDTIKNTLGQGQDIHGFALYTSTFGEFESGGGKEYFDLCKRSYSHKRNDNGFTASGMVTLFIPAFDGYDGYIDEFGYSIIDDPKEPYINMEGLEKFRGARSVLESERSFLEETQNWSGLNTEKRNNPFTMEEAAQKSTRSNYWDVSKLNTNISRLLYRDDIKPIEVDLEWEDGRMFVDGLLSKVKIVDAGLSGKEPKFKISYRPPEAERNQFVYDELNNTYKPKTQYIDRFVLGCDPFAFNNQDTTGKKKSNGGGAMYYKQDETIDGFKPDSEKVTGVFVLTYNNRVETIDEYCEDMAKAAIFFNALVSTERNVAHIITKFREWKIDGYLLYAIDPMTGLKEKVAGFRSDINLYEKMFTKYASYIENHAHRERHVEILEQIRDTDSFQEVTHNDLFAAGGMALLGAESSYGRLLKEDDEGHSTEGWAELYD